MLVGTTEHGDIASGWGVPGWLQFWLQFSVASPDEVGALTVEAIS